MARTHQTILVMDYLIRQLKCQTNMIHCQSPPSPPLRHLLHSQGETPLNLICPSSRQKQAWILSEFSPLTPPDSRIRTITASLRARTPSLKKSPSSKRKGRPTVARNAKARQRVGAILDCYFIYQWAAGSFHCRCSQKLHFTFNVTITADSNQNDSKSKTRQCLNHAQKSKKAAVTLSYGVLL